MTTIGGVVFRHLDRLPREGDEVLVEGTRMTVLKVSTQRIVRLRVASDGQADQQTAAGESAGQPDGNTGRDRGE